MKIAFITSMKSGLPQFVFRDIKALIDRGHYVRLFTLLNVEGLYNPLRDWDIVPIRFFQTIKSSIWFILRNPILFSRLFIESWKMSSLVDLAMAINFSEKMRDFDIIFAYFGDHKLFTGYFCKRITQIPLIVSIRAYELHQNPNPKMFIKALNNCDRIITISEYNKSILVNKYGIQSNQIEMVRQLIDLTKFKYERKIKILIVAFFSEKKGHDILFNAFKNLNRDDVELWVVGDEAPDRNNVDCRDLVEKLGLVQKVAFFGTQSDVALRALYRECDIFCLPSRTDSYGDHEGFPNAIAEAMAFGKPVVSTLHAGIPEIVDEILVPENNVEQLANALHRACDSIEYRKELGENNRIIVEQHFSSSNSDRVEDILLRYAKRQ